MSRGGYRVAVVGATGMVGSTMLEVLAERNFPAREIVPFASRNSVGRVIDGNAVQSLNDETILGFDIALFSAGSTVSDEWAPRFVEAGAIVIDNSSRWRMESDVPLVVAEVNPEAAKNNNGIIANPNCSAMQLLVALKPIHDTIGIERIIVTTYQATSGTGQKAVQELIEQTQAVLNNVEIETPKSYKHQIAFNILPHAGVFSPGDDHTDEERKLINETKKILADDTIRIAATCARVPVINGHSQAVNIETKRPITPKEVSELLASTPGVTIADDPQAAHYPLPIHASGQDNVLVGRIRRDPSHENGLWLWVVADNLRKGAATNAVQIAELLEIPALAQI